MEKNLHIICPDSLSHIFYGTGSLLFFEIEIFKNSGVGIFLHVFGEEAVSERISRHCEEVFHYPLNTGHKALAIGLPYEVASRCHPLLQERLKMDQHPVLLYGWECTGILAHFGEEDEKRFFVRAAGIPHILSREAVYFSSGLGKKLFHFNEALRTRKFEKTITKAATFLALHEKDLHCLQKSGHSKALLVPMMLLPQQTVVNAGTGNYCFYFGDFSNPEHEKSAIWLLEEVFSGVDFPFVLAGKNASPSLKKLALKNELTCLVEDPSEEELTDLIRKSHIQILPLFSATGLKSEIYHALLHGRHCLYYGAGYTCPLVKESCHAIENPAHARSLIQSLFYIPFHEEAIPLRNKYFDTLNNSIDRAAQLLSSIYQEAPVQ